MSTTYTTVHGNSILNPLSKAGVEPMFSGVLPSQVCYCWAMARTPVQLYFKMIIYRVCLFGFFWFFFFPLFRATPIAFGDSHTGDWTRATAVGLHHSLQQHWILYPLSKARDQTRNLTVTSWIHFHCATMGTLTIYSFDSYRIIFHSSSTFS